MYFWMLEAETAPPFATPENDTERQNDQVARLMPPYVPVEGASGTAAAKPVMFLPLLPVPSP